MSTLGRLLTFALPAGLADFDRRIAAENFTTEALAGAIRRNSVPMRSALSRAGVAISDRDPDATLTQVVYNGPHGRVIPDLLLAWEGLDPIETWIEVKVGAPLSGETQLVRYRQTMDWLTAVDAVPRQLVLLAPTDLRPTHDLSAVHQGVEADWVPWQGIVSAVNAGGLVGDLWLDLADFLEEQGMTRGTNFPISAREIVSLRDAHQLFEKGVALLTATNRAVREMALGGPEYWWPDGQIRRGAAGQFERKGRVMLSGASKYRAPFFYGLAPDVNGEALLTVWVEVGPRFTATRHGLLAWFADHKRSLPEWTINREDRYFAGWPVLVATESPVNLPTQNAARDWLVARLTELTNAGYLDLVAALSRQPAAEVEPDPSTDVEEPLDGINEL